MRLSNRGSDKKLIPEGLGSGKAHVWPYVFGLSLNALFHLALLFLYGWSVSNVLYLFISFLFFIYPCYYVVDVLWSLRPSICDILSGKTLINRTFYMNTMRGDVASHHYSAVTISIPVYMEDNEVLFETIKNSIMAADRYRQVSGQRVNIIVSDDGMAPLLGGFCSFERLEELFMVSGKAGYLLSPSERKALARVEFYRNNGIAFVSRPWEGRKGLFKKASNLNYTIKLGRALEQGAEPEELLGENREFGRGYAEGDVITNEIILLLDKDSGVPEEIMEGVVPEFYFDHKLAYIQCATKAANMAENYFTYAEAHHVNNLFFHIWPCKALQGFFVPLVGHNVFLKKSILEESGLWAEDKVSEDYDKAICFYNMGYHGKYAQIKGLEFTEYVSRCFVEETVKQYRYSYGLFEMIFDGTLDLKRTRKCDSFYMFLYFFSVLNEVLLLPTVLMELYFGNIHMLWAGFIVCNFCFIVLPCLRGFIMRYSLPGETTEKISPTLIIAISFVGHSFSMLKGALRYLTNKIRPNTRPFPSSIVSEMRYGFRAGLGLVLDFIKNNKFFLLIIVLCLDRGLFMLTKRGIEPVTVISYSYILFGTILCPLLLTPQFFRRRREAKVNRGEENTGEEERLRSKNQETHRKGGWKMDKENMSAGIDEFLASYDRELQEGVRLEEIPERITASYHFESCIKKDEAGRKQIYLLRRREDEKRAILRITVDYAEEDALDEARLLDRLAHDSLPKVYDAFEEGGKKYIIREYIEGRSLDEVIQTKGVLGTGDIFDIVLKLADVLHYLHTQTPPVIHRDIKPQNIILDGEGGVHLIDFGIARVHKKGRTQDTFVVLTQDYAPPEQYGFDQTSTLTDIYSTGIVMLYMATGNLLRNELEAQIINNRLRILIHKCIALDPKNRIQSVDEIVDYIRSQGGRRKKRLGLYVTTFVCLGVLGLSLLSYVLGIQRGEGLGHKLGYDSGYGVGYTDGYEAAPVFELPETMAVEEGNGNYYGNMSVEGCAFAAEGDESIFYILDGDIYSMAKDGSDIRCIVQGEEAKGLSYYNGWLYYNSLGDIVQTNIYTSRRDVIMKDSQGTLYIEGGNYYIVEEDRLLLFDPESAKMIKLLDLSPHEYLNILRDRIFYVAKGTADLMIGDLPKQGREGGSDGNFVYGLSKDIDSGLCIYDNKLYCSIKEDDTAKLICMNFEKEKLEFVSELNCKAFQVCDRGIYYIDSLDGSLNLCTLDGRFQMRITDNRVTSFNLAGDYIIYHNQADGEGLWSVRADGTDDHLIRSGR